LLVNIGSDPAAQRPPLAPLHRERPSERRTAFCGYRRSSRRPGTRVRDRGHSRRAKVLRRGDPSAATHPTPGRASAAGGIVAPAAWNPVEQTLHEALAKAARAAQLPERDRIKYEASATHQEILARLGETEADRNHVFGFVRRPTGNTDARLEELKSHLRVHEFDRGDTAALCDAVFTQLLQVIEAEVRRFEDQPAVKRTSGWSVVATESRSRNAFSRREALKEKRPQ